MEPEDVNEADILCVHTVNMIITHSKILIKLMARDLIIVEDSHFK